MSLRDKLRFMDDQNRNRALAQALNIDYQTLLKCKFQLLEGANQNEIIVQFDLSINPEVSRTILPDGQASIRLNSSRFNGID